MLVDIVSRNGNPDVEFPLAVLAARSTTKN